VQPLYMHALLAASALVMLQTTVLKAFHLATSRMTAWTLLQK